MGDLIWIEELGYYVDEKEYDAMYKGIENEATVKWVDKNKPTPTSTKKCNKCERGMMSKCGCRKLKDFKSMEEACTFAKKHSHENRCTHLVFDEYCDSLEAQTDRESRKLTTPNMGL